MSDTIVQKVRETADYLKQQCNFQAEIAIILGSGLGNFATNIRVEKEVLYKDIPNFHVSTVKGHSGRMIFGELSGKKIVAMSGRFHYYEGHTPQDVVFPIRVLGQLGVKTLLLSNAAGGVNPDFEVGDIMLINDHITRRRAPASPAMARSMPR